MKKGVVIRGKPTKHIITPEMRAAIKETYQTTTGSGEVRELAKRLGLPRWKITKYAQKNGLTPIRKKEPDWSERELRILQQSSHRDLATIQKHLKKAGYRRTVTGIALKRKRMRFLRNLDGHSSRQVAEGFGVDDHCITRWIRQGYLKAKKRGTARTARQRGDIWYITDAQIRDFIINCIDEIDIRKVDKYWFVDLLAGGRSGIGECKTQRSEIGGQKPEEEDDVDPEILDIFAEAQNY